MKWFNDVSRFVIPRVGVHTGRVFRVRADRVRVCRVSDLKILYRARPTYVRIYVFSDARVSGFVGRVLVGFGFINCIFGFYAKTKDRSKYTQKTDQNTHKTDQNTPKTDQNV